MSLLGTLNFATAIDNSGLRQGTINAQGILHGFANNINKADIFAGLAFGGVLAMGKIATSAFNTSKAYQTAMKEIETVSDATKNDFEGMSDAIANVGIDGKIPQTAEQLAKAFYDIASAGYDGQKGINVLDVSARAAVGGITDTKIAADGITTSLNAWKLEASKASDVSDKLFQTVRLGKTTFPELASNLSKVASLAAASGVSLDEVLGAVASMTKQGVPTAEAFTQIKAALISTNDVLKDGWANSMALQDAFAKIAEKAGGSQTKLKDMVGSAEAMNAILSLTGDNAKMAASDLNSISNAAGAAETAFQTMLLTAENQSKLLVINLQNAFKPLGDFLVNTFTDVASWLNKAFQDGTLETFAKAVGIAVSALIAYKTTTALTSITVADFNRVLDAAKKALKALNVVASANPFGLIAAGIATAIGVYFAFIRETNKMSRAQTMLADVTEQTGHAIAAEKVQVEQLLAVAKDDKKSKEERLAAVRKLNEIAPEYLGNITLEKIHTEETTTAVNAYIKALENKTRTIIAQEKLVELEKELFTAQLKRLETEKELIASQEHLSKFSEKLAAGAAGFDSRMIEGYSNAVHEAEVGLLGVNTQIENILATKAEFMKMVDTLGVSVVAPDSTGDTGGAKPVRGKPKTDNTHLENLRQALADAKVGLEELSDVETEINSTAVSSQNAMIARIEAQIQRQEIILGLRKEEVVVTEEQADADNKAKEGSLKYLQEKLSIAEENYALATDDTTRKVYLEEIDLISAQIESLDGLESVRINLIDLSYKELLQYRKILQEQLKGVEKTSEAYQKLQEDISGVNSELENQVRRWAEAGVSGINLISQIVGDINSELAEMLSMIADISADAVNIGLSIASGDIVGAVTSGLQILSKLITKAQAEKREKTEREVAYNIELQNRLLERQMEILGKSVGVERLKEYKAALTDLTSRIADYENAVKQTAETTNNSRTYNHFETPAEMQAWQDEALLMNEDYQKLVGQKEELLAQLGQEFTTTTSTNITDSIVEGFANGKLAVEDFAGTFEDLMRNAILQTFRTQFLEKQFAQFYQSFSDAAISDGALSSSEIENLRGEFSANIENARAGFETFDSMFTDLFGNGLAGTNTGETKQGMVGEIRSSLTEETGTVLAGTLNSIRLYVAQNTQILGELHINIIELVSNSRYLQRLENIERILQEQSNNLRGAGV